MWWMPEEQIPLLWSTVGETALAKGFSSNMGDTKRSFKPVQTQF